MTGSIITNMNIQEQLMNTPKDKLSYPGGSPIGKSTPMTFSTIGRFGHHSDPAIDFCIEVDCLEGLSRNVCCGMDKKAEVSNRIFKAMTFRVGGDEGAVRAKSRLRELEKMVNEFEPEEV